MVNNEELLEDNLLKKVSGGNDQSPFSLSADQCFTTILNGDAFEALCIYHDFYNDINNEEREFLAQQYQDAFQCDINDECCPDF